MTRIKICCRVVSGSRLSMASITRPPVPLLLRCYARSAHEPLMQSMEEGAISDGAKGTGEGSVLGNSADARSTERTDYLRHGMQDASGPSIHMQQASPRMKLQSVLSSLEAYSSTCDVHGLWQLVSHSGVRLDEQSATFVVDGLVLAGQVEKAWHLLRELARRGFKPGRMAYAAVVCAFRLTGDIERCLKVLKEMRSCGMQPDVLQYNLVLEACVDAKLCERTFQLADDMRTHGVALNGETYRILINCASSSGDTQRLLQLCEEMESEEVLLTAHTLEAVVSCLTGAKLHETARKLRERSGVLGLRSKGDGNAAAYLQSICAAGGAGSWDRAKSLIEEVLARGLIGVDVQLDKMAVRLAALNNDLGLLRSLEEAGLKRDSKTYSWLMTGYRRLEMWEEVLRVGRMMQSKQIAWSSTAWNSVMAAFAALGMGNEAWKLYWKMVRAPDVQPEPYTYTKAIEALVRSGQLSRAIQLQRQSDDMDMEPARREMLYSALARGAAKLGQWQTVLSLIGNLAKMGLRVNPRLHNLANTALARAGETQKAVQYLDKLETRELDREPVLGHYNSAIHAAAKAGDVPLILSLYQRLLQRGIIPDACTYSTAIHGCGEARDLATATRLFQDMLARGIKPAVHVFVTLMSAQTGAGDIDAACGTWYRAEASGVMLNSVAYTTLLSGFTEKGLWPCALYVHDEACVQEEYSVALVSAAAEALEDSALEPFLERIYAYARQADLKEHWSSRWLSYVDLHAFTRPMARIAVKCALQEVAEGRPVAPEGLVIIVGKSGGFVREEVTKMLTEEMDPPLDPVECTGNSGRICVPLESVDEWLAARGKPRARVELRAGAWLEPTDPVATALVE